MSKTKVDNFLMFWAATDGSQRLQTLILDLKSVLHWLMFMGVCLRIMLSWDATRKNVRVYLFINALINVFIKRFLSHTLEAVLSESFYKNRLKYVIKREQ